MNPEQNARSVKKDRTRKRILKAAVRVFAELGFEAASMGAIASRAGMKKALVQYHFQTKMNLWQEAIDSLWGELEHLESGLPKLNPDMTAEQERAAIRESFRAIIRFAKNHPDWVGIMFREASTPGPRLNWLVENHLRKNIADGVSFVEKAQSLGLLPEGSALHIIHIISGALTYIMLVAPLTREATGIDLTVEESLDTTVDMLLAMLRPGQETGVRSC